MKVARWGNSLAIRLPAAVVKRLDLREGDQVSIETDGTPKLTIAREPTLAERIEGLRRFEGRLPKDFKFDREEANAR